MRPGPAPPLLLLLLVAAPPPPRPGAAVAAAAASAALDRRPLWSPTPTPATPTTPLLPPARAHAGDRSRALAPIGHNLKYSSAFAGNHLDDESSSEEGDAGLLHVPTAAEAEGPARKEGNLTVGDLKVELVAKKKVTLGYLTAVTGDLKERQGLTVSGAIKMAIDEINNDPYVLPNVELQLRWYDTRGETVLATKAMTDMICDGVAAFFGPEGSCHVEAIVAQSRNIPMISYKCSDYKASQVPTFARTEPPETQVTKSIVSLLEYYKWNKFSVIYEEPWKTVAESLFVQAKAKNMTVNYKKQAKDRHKCCEDNLKCCQVGYWYEFIQDTKNRTRIYVFLGTTVSLVDLMNTMQTAQLFEKGEYIVVYVDMDNFLEKQAHKYLFKLDVFEKYKSCSELSDYNAFVKRAKSLFIVIPTAPTNNYENFTKRVREYNEKEPFNFHISDIFGSFENFVSIYAAYLFDSVKLYASSLDFLIKNTSVSVLTDKVLTDIVSDGTKIIQTIIQINQTYRSISGAMMKLDKYGDSEGNFSVLAYRSDTDDIVVHKNFTCKFRMAPVGQFFQSDDLEFPEYKLNLDTTIQWAGGTKPNDEPSCGFSNELCPKPNTHLNSIVVAGVLAIILFCAAVITVSIYRKWKIEQEIEGLLWKVNRDDIHFFFGYDNMISSPSRLSLASASVTSYESRGGVQMFATVAQYRGVMVRVKELNFSRKKDISREVMKEMRLLRELRHDNVNSFIGACVQPMSLLLLSDYCAKGSLYDIIENEDIKLDKMFVASLVHDLLKGMLYIHYSMLGVHGNLKSSNCVVTSRWVLQVTDFGLAEMRHCAENDNSIGEHQYYRSLFWKAPEILRNPNLYLRGTQKGDIYAFAIILYEILGRRGPFGPTGYEPKDIIELVKKEPLDGEDPFRPDVEILFDAEIGCEDYVLQIMQDCWAENPDNRPDFSAVRSKLKRLKDGTNKNIMDQMMDMMVTYANNLEDLVNERTMLLHEEKNKTEDLLHRMLPKPVAERLTKGYGVEPESFDSVTIYFSDIVGFTAMSAESSPLQVVNFLNDLYTVFDKIIKGYDVYKVETIGDAYMVVSGLPIRNGDTHAGEIASMALDLLAAVKNHSIPHRPNETLKLRIGIHTGPVVAGVVGLTMPRYCLFGDTVNTASRMESNGEPLKIHISPQCRDSLQKLGGYVIKERGVVHMKGKGDVKTFWLMGATEKAVQRREVDLGELPPLFCRPRRSPKLCNESRQPSVCGGFGGINSRRHSSVPREAGGGTARALAAAAAGSVAAPGFVSGAADALRQLESLDAPRWGVRPVRVLSSIDGSSTDEQSRSQPTLNRIRESKSLDPLPLGRHRPVDPLGTYLRLDFGFPRRSTKSLENCDKCGDIQIIAVPEDKVLNNNFPNGTLVGAAPEEVGDGGVAAEDAHAPLLDATVRHPAIVRRRGGSAVDDVPDSDISKRWRSLDPLPPSCDSLSDIQSKKVTPRTSLKNWLVGIFNPNGLKSSNTSLRKGVLNDYNNLQSEKESVV